MQIPFWNLEFILNSHIRVMGIRNYVNIFAVQNCLYRKEENLWNTYHNTKLRQNVQRFCKVCYNISGNSFVVINPLKPNGNYMYHLL
jgi:hypothetical protein